MDKTRKLRKYQHKDYSRLVDFPVEIVGRDGVVRTYTFEDSIRLYLRRIATAVERYEDPELAQAEVGHCEQRIQQLRRSYFERYTPDSLRRLGRPAGDLAGELVAEVAAFLRRVAERDDLALDAWTLHPAEAAGTARVFLASATGRPARLLYFFPLAPDAGDTREEYRRLRATLRPRGGGDGVERVLAVHETPDLALVLTGTESPSEGAEPPYFSDRPTTPWSGHSNPFNAALRKYQEGDVAAALEEFQGLLETLPGNRQVALLAAMLADQLGQHEEAEFAARLGLASNPGDPMLRYQLGFSLLRQQRRSAAQHELTQALALDPRCVPARFLLAVMELRAGRSRVLDRLIQGAELVGSPLEAQLMGRVRALRSRLRWRRRGLLAGALAAGGSLSLVISGQATGWAWFALSVAVTLGLAWATRLRGDHTSGVGASVVAAVVERAARGLVEDPVQ